MAHGEQLFGRSAETEPKDVRLSGVNVGDDPFFITLSAQISAAVADNVELGIKRSDAPRRLLYDRVDGSEQKNTYAASLGNLSDVVKKVRRANAFGKRRFMKKARDQHQRHAIRVNEIGLEEQIANLRLPGAHREYLAIRGGKDERRQCGVAAAQRDIDHELRRLGAVYHRNRQSTDRGDRHLPSRFSSCVKVNTAGLCRHGLRSCGPDLAAK